MIESGERVFGVGEAGTPTSAPALGSAILCQPSNVFGAFPLINRSVFPDFACYRGPAAGLQCR
jgi:hypothetical protein